MSLTPAGCALTQKLGAVSKGVVYIYLTLKAT